MSPQPGVPVLRQVVLDTTDVRALAEFYRRLLDLQYRPGDEHPGADAPDPRGQDWAVSCGVLAWVVIPRPRGVR